MNLSCPICLKAFQTENDFKGHLTSVHGKKALEFSKVFQNTDENKKEFQCLICLKSFKTKYYLKNHISKVHEEKNPEILPRPPKTNRLIFSCFICAKVLQSQADVKRHISMVHPFRCVVCSKVFQSEADVKIHYSTDHGIIESNNQVHEKNQPIQCPFCPSKFGHKVEFNKHVSMVHEEKRISVVDQGNSLKGIVI
jgi:uncharacterized C2H2 Zn-finger protein